MIENKMFFTNYQISFKITKKALSKNTVIGYNDTVIK